MEACAIPPQRLAQRASRPESADPICQAPADQSTIRPAEPRILLHSVDGDGVQRITLEF
jgi:hypothetical protein